MSRSTRLRQFGGLGGPEATATRWHRRQPDTVQNWGTRRASVRSDRRCQLRANAIRTRGSTRSSTRTSELSNSIQAVVLTPRWTTEMPRARSPSPSKVAVPTDLHSGPKLWSTQRTTSTEPIKSSATATRVRNAGRLCPKHRDQWRHKFTSPRPKAYVRATALKLPTTIYVPR